MSRRRKSGLDEIASWPWPVGIAAGIGAFLLIRYGIGAWFAAVGGPLLGPVGLQIGGMMAPLAWIVMLACWAAAAVSWANARRRRTLHDTRRDLDSLAEISWREFEMLVGESFRRRGYEVVENGLGGKDGGIDLIVSRDGRRKLVQCKQWKRRQVGAATVREMWGLVDHHRADAVHIVCIGDFTPDAAAFAQGKAIELVSGARLLAIVRELQRDVGANTQVSDRGLHARIEPVLSPQATASPLCPACDSTMVQRHNRRTGAQFWGCPSYPRCAGTRPG